MDVEKTQIQIKDTHILAYLRPHLRLISFSFALFVLAYFQEGIEVAMFAISLILANYVNCKLAFSPLNIMQVPKHILIVNVLVIFVANFMFFFSVKFNHVMYLYVLAIPFLGGVAVYVFRRAPR